MKSRHRTENTKSENARFWMPARSILIRRGYQDVRLDDISRSAGISKGALYLYFRDKEDLFAAVLGDLVERLEARLQGIPPQGSALDMLRKTAQEELAFVDENKDFIVHFSLEKPSLCEPGPGRSSGEGSPNTCFFSRNASRPA
ncbi:MAG: TetR/AcrR family transcriptional regulator [Elusimicrobia bacterium]|nr:TetR/AcrR family transcriptional regulator [Elusimicrobiota bacterium]